MDLVLSPSLSLDMPPAIPAHPFRKTLVEFLENNNSSLVIRQYGIFHHTSRQGVDGWMATHHHPCSLLHKQQGMQLLHWRVNKTYKWFSHRSNSVDRNRTRDSATKFRLAFGFPFMWIRGWMGGWEAGKPGGRMWGQGSTTKRYIFKINVSPFCSALFFGRSAGSVIQ